MFSKKCEKKGGDKDNLLIKTGNLLLSHLRTIFAVMMLNFCVRYGYRCLHHAIITGSLPLQPHSKLNSSLSLHSLSLG